MSSSALLALFFYTIANSYHLSLNTFEFQAAENYCIQHCGSHLASLHSVSDYYQLVNLITDTTSDSVMNIKAKTNTFIGLNDIINNNIYVWTDGSTLDYLNNTVKRIGTFPFQFDEPGTDDCIIMEGLDAGGDYMLNDEKCTFLDFTEAAETMFACNHCNGILTKYVILDDAEGINRERNAQKLSCENRFGTGMASIHSDSDVNSIHKLCNISMSQTISTTGIDQGCWIGLYDNNLTENVDYNFVWDDGTTFDFTNWESVEFIEPDGSGQCVEMRNTVGFPWADTNCNNNRKAICNMPSEICWQDQWTVIDEYDTSNILWSIKPCQLSVNQTNTNINRMIMGNKRWDNGDKMLVIEYMYTIEDINIYSQAGIILYSNCGCDEYYFIGIDAYTSIVLMAYVWNGVYSNIKREKLPFTYQTNVYYELRIEISKTENYIVVYVNNNRLIVTDYILNGNNDGLSPYIGISYNNASVIAKSLFISGTSVREYKNDTIIQSWFEPCNPTTNIPFSCVNENSVILTISFNYTLTNQLTTISEIENALSFATSLFITIQIDERTECIISDYTLNILLSSSSFVAVIIADICFHCDDGKLHIDLTNTLDNDFVDRVEETTPILSIVTNSTKIDVDIIPENENEIDHDSMLTTQFIIKNTIQKTEENSFYVILYVFIALLCVCCLLLSVAMCSKIKKQRNERKDSQLTIIECKPDANMTLTLSLPSSQLSNEPIEETIVTIDEQKYDSAPLDMKEILEVKGNEYENDEINKNEENKCITQGHLENDEQKHDDGLEIKRWLENVVGLSEYYNNFIENGYQSMQFVKAIENELELREIDILIKEHQTLIMKEIKRLNGNEYEYIPTEGMGKTTAQ
eukprot:164774_1